MTKIRIRKLNDDAIIPGYATDGSAAVDLRALRFEYAENDEQRDNASSILKVFTGVAMEIPDGYVGLIVPRSSLGIKGITLANGTGVVDSDYRGEIIVFLEIDRRAGSFELNSGGRIAQMLFVPAVRAEFDEVAELSETKRGSGGFGSTGL